MDKKRLITGMSIYADDEMKAFIEKKAKEDGRKPSNWVTNLIRKEMLKKQK